MTSAGEQRAQLDARSAVMREKVVDLLDQFQERTTRLREAQQAAAALTATLTSPDGVVRVTVDATGMLTELSLAATAFDHTRPDALASTISDLVRQATMRVRRQAAELMRPLTEGLPELPDLVEGAPSLTEMLPKIPDYPAPAGVNDHSGSGSTPPAHRPSPATSNDDDTEMPDSWMIPG